MSLSSTSLPTRSIQNTRRVYEERKSILLRSMEMLPCQPCMHVVLRLPFMLALSLLSQRQHASGLTPAAAEPLFIVQQVEEAVQLQVIFQLM